MCIQPICPTCSAPFTSPPSITRCPVFQRHNPPLDLRILACPANNWTTAPHPTGSHPGGGRCPGRGISGISSISGSDSRTGPYYLGTTPTINNNNNANNSGNNNNNNNNAANNSGNNNNNNNIIRSSMGPPPTPTPTAAATRGRLLAPAASRARVRRLPHEGSDLYVRPGDLFKPGVWQRVAASMETLPEREVRIERETRQKVVELEELEEERRQWEIDRKTMGPWRWEEVEVEEVEEEEKGEEGRGEEEEGGRRRRVGDWAHDLVAAQWRTG